MNTLLFITGLHCSEKYRAFSRQFRIKKLFTRRGALYFRGSAFVHYSIDNLPMTLGTYQCEIETVILKVGPGV